MVLSIKDAQLKYSDQLRAIMILDENIQSAGYRIEKSNDFELGAHWDIWDNASKIASFEWNVPHYLVFDFEISQEESFSIDYVKGAKMWDSFLDDVRTSLLDRK